MWQKNSPSFYQTYQILEATFQIVSHAFARLYNIELLSSSSSSSSSSSRSSSSSSNNVAVAAEP